MVYLFKLFKHRLQGKMEWRLLTFEVCMDPTS